MESESDGAESEEYSTAFHHFVSAENDESKSGSRLEKKMAVMVHCAVGLMKHVRSGKTVQCETDHEMHAYVVVRLQELIIYSAVDVV